MVWDVSFTCDICGKKKADANHWWMVLLGDVPCYDPGEPRQRFTILPWNRAESRNSDMMHVCGQGCAMKALERFMTTSAMVVSSPAASMPSAPETAPPANSRASSPASLMAHAEEEAAALK